MLLETKIVRVDATFVIFGETSVTNVLRDGQEVKSTVNCV